MITTARRQPGLLAGAIFIAAIIVTAVTSPTRSALAAGDPTPEATARAHFRRGEADYAAGKYAVALEEYQAGYDAAPLPGFLVNMAQCQRRLGDLARARASYSKFIMVAPDSPLVPEVTRLVSELDRLLAESQGADNAPRAPAGPDDIVEPGSATAVAPSSSRTAGAPPPMAPPALSLTPPQPAASPPRHVDESTGRTSDSESSFHPRWWLWAGVAVVAAGAVTTAILLGSRDPDTIHEGSLGTLRR